MRSVHMAKGWRCVYTHLMLFHTRVHPLSYVSVPLCPLLSLFTRRELSPSPTLTSGHESNEAENMAHTLFHTHGSTLDGGLASRWHPCRERKSYKSTQQFGKWQYHLQAQMSPFPWTFIAWNSTLFSFAGWAGCQLCCWRECNQSVRRPCYSTYGPFNHWPCWQWPHNSVR